MDTSIIKETSHRSMSGAISFPEAVSQLLAAGVEYYRVDYVGMKTEYYGAGGDLAVTSIPFEGLPPVAAEFAVSELRANILDSQRNGQSYRDFTRRAMSAGVQSYIAFLAGKRVTYLGRQGNQHTEWFPGAAQS